MIVSEIEIVSGSPEPSPERVLITCLKAAIKENSVDLRAEKAMVRQMQRSFANGADGLQARLAYHRVEARARLLMYGLLRGRSWERIESNHGPLNGRFVFTFKRVYAKAQAAVAKETGVTLPLPDVLTQVKI